MSLIYDLHTHSYCSDGELSPETLVALAKSEGVDVLSLTDHDTVAGISRARAAAGDDLRLIAGIELSSLWQGRNIHVVGLNLDIDHPVLLQGIAQQYQARISRAKTIADKLAKAGMVGAWEGALHYAKEGNVGRPHFARYLVESGYCTSIADAFKRYLGSGKAGDVKQHWPEMSAVIQWINAAGGTAVLAHPDKYKLTRTKLYRLLEDFCEAGGRGLEVVSGLQDANVTAKLAKAAVDFSLLISCGSDFHTSSNPWQSPGKMSIMPTAYEAVWDSW